MVTPEHYEHLGELFAAACKLPPGERAALLDRECADDPSLRTEVEALLAKDADSKSFLESPALGDDFRLQAGATRLEPERSLVGEHISRYRITRAIAAGGMGAVYEAEQEHPKRAVALKVIRGGKFVDEHRIKLFEREVQTLARLEHAHIAAIYEAGRTAEGQHFFAMELVRGVPLMEFARTRQLAMRTRLELFGKICQAINCAHQRGVIHRDLKPSNILIDAEGNPKILDFGLAKMTESDVALTTVETELGKIEGTLPYMSPEQARGKPDQIDLRSDVYSLGVILYELLTEELPYEVSSTRGLPEAVRVICEEAPRKPSTISKMLRGDVETIALKALEKEPSRRYQSASAFADDVQRYLTNQPILARPPSAMYQLKKLAARHKVPFAFIAALFVLTTSSSIWMTVLYRQALDAQDLAQERLAETGQARDESETVTKFLTDMLGAVDTAEEGKEVTVLQALDQAAKTVGDDFKDKPLIEARLHATIGRTYFALWQHDAADQHLQRALEIRRQMLGEEHVDTLSSMNDLGARWATVNLVRYRTHDDAEPLLQQALETATRVLGAEHPVTLTAMHNLAWLYAKQQRFDESEKLFQEVIQTRQRVLGEDHRDTLASLDDLAEMYIVPGRYDEAEPLFLQALAARKRALGEHDRDTLESMDNLVGLYKSQGRYDKAKAILLELLEIQKRVHGKNDPDTLRTMTRLGYLYMSQGSHDQAEALALQMLETNKRLYGEQHVKTQGSKHFLATVYANMGRYEEAEPIRRDLLEAKKRVLGEEHQGTLMATSHLANMYRDWGRYDQAEPLYLEGLKVAQRSPEEWSGWWERSFAEKLAGLYKKWGRFAQAEPLFLQMQGEKKSPNSIGILAEFYRAWGRYEQAEPLYLQALELSKQTRGEEARGTQFAMGALAQLYADMGRYDEAEPLYLQALETLKRISGDENLSTLAEMSLMADMYTQQGRYHEAEPLHAQAVAGIRRLRGEKWWFTAYTLLRHGVCLGGLQRYEEAETALIEACETLKNTQGEANRTTLTCISELGDLYTKLGRYDEAEPLLAQAAAESRKTLPEHWRTGLFLMRHGVCLIGLERFDEAEAALLEAHEIIAAHLGPEHERTIKVVKQITDLYESWAAAEPNAGYAVKTTEWRAKLADTASDSPSP